MRHHVGVSSVRYTIGALSTKTGLTPHTIRAWERRYAALSPNRSDANQREYGDAELERLKLLKRVTDQGNTISKVAQLSIEELKRLAQPEPTDSFVESTTQEDGSLLKAAEQAMMELDSAELLRTLERGTALLGITGMLEQIVLPLLERVGWRWSEGTASVSEEHLATVVIRTYLDRLRASIMPGANAPRIVVTTPAKQHHEIGAMIVAITVASLGWHVTYLGPSLPSEEIADAVRRSRAQAVALSIVYPNNDPDLDAELRAIRTNLGARMPIIVGGRAAAGYAEALFEIGARVINRLSDLEPALRTWA